MTGDILVLIPSSLEDLVTCFVTPENGQIVEQITAWMEANWLPASARVKGHLVAA